MAKLATISISPLIVLAFIFLLLAFLVLLQELALFVHLNTPFLAVSIHDRFIDDFAVLHLFLDLLDRVGTSFIFDWRLHRGGQIGQLNGLFDFFLSA